MKGDPRSIRPLRQNASTLSRTCLETIFAVELLKKHVSVDHVAMLLADDPDTVKQHYYPWVPELQDLPEKEVKRQCRGALATAFRVRDRDHSGLMAERSWDEDAPIILPDVDDS